MTPSYFLTAVLPAAYQLLPDEMRSNKANTMLLAIGLQESRFEYRRQIMGPARGFWQFEFGGVDGVLSHPSSKAHASHVVGSLNYPHSKGVIQEALADNDIMAAAFARLLLWTDPHPLPNDADDALDYYLRTWRPRDWQNGGPHPDTWSRFWDRANREVQYATRRVEVQA